MPDGTSQLGKIDAAIAAEGATGEPFTGAFTYQYVRDGFHLLPQPLFSVLSPSDPNLQLKFTTNWHWQALLGWTLLKRNFVLLGQHLEFSMEQSIGAEFGPGSKEHGFIATLLQGQVKYPVTRSNIYLAAEVGFSGAPSDDKNWKLGFDGAIKIGWEFDVAFKRSK